MKINKSEFVVGEVGIEAVISNETFDEGDYAAWFEVSTSPDGDKGTKHGKEARVRWSDGAKKSDGVTVEIAEYYETRIHVTVSVAVGATLGDRDVRVKGKSDDFTLANGVKIVPPKASP